MNLKRHRWRYDPGGMVYTCVFDALPLPRLCVEKGPACHGCGAEVTDREVVDGPFMGGGLDEMWARKPLAAFVDLVLEAE